jgi:flagellar protein FlbT
MSASMRISLRNGERIYVNGAVLRVDRKVTIELLNDVTFLLEGQVMQAQEATTPLRQLYFIVQLMLMSPADAGEATDHFQKHLAAIRAVVESADIIDGLVSVERLVEAGRPYDALKVIRGLYPNEQAILERGDADRPVVAA